MRSRWRLVLDGVFKSVDAGNGYHGGGYGNGAASGVGGGGGGPITAGTAGATTFTAFRVRARTRRASIPESLPRLAAGDAVALGWAANELAQPARVRLLDYLVAAAGAGHPLLVLEPLARGVAPWWPTWAAASMA